MNRRAQEFLSRKRRLWPRAVNAAVVFTFTLAAACNRPGPLTEASCGPELLNVDSLPRLLVMEEQRSGGDPTAGFISIAAAAVGPDSVLYIVDGGAFTITAVDRNGEVIRVFGGRGSGPGEFRSAPRIGFDRGNVWAIDELTRRISLFDGDGTLLSSTRIDGARVPLQDIPWLVGGPSEPTYDGLLVPSIMRPDGLFMGRMAYVPAGTLPRGAATDTVRVPIVLFDIRGQISDSIGFYLEAPREPRVLRTIEVAGRMYTLPQPPLETPLRLETLDGRYIVERPVASSEGCGTLRITKVDVAGKEAFTKQLWYIPKTYSQEYVRSRAVAAAGAPEYATVVLDERLSALLPLRRMDPSSELFAERFSEDVVERAAAEIASHVEFSRFRPPVEAYLLGVRGELWLAREIEPGMPRSWIVMAEDGAIRGQVELPVGARLAWAGNDDFLVIERDDLGVESVVHYRINTAMTSP